MVRTVHPIVAWALVLTGSPLLFTTVQAQQPAQMSAAEKIASAMSAAPADVASKATILDWPASDTAHFTVLRPGTNGWVCYPDIPGTQGNDPMCVDKAWQTWMQAYMEKKPPRITNLGLSYMIAPGGGNGSNTDPFATAPTADNQWGHDGPHVMIVVPDPAALQGLPITRQESAPFVMWVGTPYAHIMMPVPAQPAAH